MGSLLGALEACGGEETTAPADAAGDKTAATTPVTGAADFKNLGDDDETITNEYVTAVAGTDIYAAFAISHNKSDGKPNGGVAYFCDGKAVANWFRLTPSGEGLTFMAASGATFTATEADGKVTAEVTLGDKTFDISAGEVDANGQAGLYLADYVIDPDLAINERGGWIVLSDGSQRGAIRGGATILPGGDVSADLSSTAVGGREILLRAITHIIGLDKKS